MKNIKSSLGQICNGLNGVEVKGYDNVNRMFGAMYMIQELIKYIDQQEEQKIKKEEKEREESKEK